GTTAATIHRAAVPQGDIGGVGGYGSGTAAGGGMSVAKPMLLSLLLPGLGEATMGYRRGYVMMALDIASWVGVKHYHDLGNEKRDAYYAYLDAHWSESALAAAFGSSTDFAGTFFYGDTMDDSADYQTLSLWVSREADEREYYENAGKWDQFVFGWDDFWDPRSWPEYNDGSWVDLTTSILKDARVSSHREIYRAMRIDSNDQFERRDTLIYVNMFTRLFSMFQVAYLGGVFSGGRPAEFKVAGHDVALIAEPRGLTASRLGVSVSY
ncbi:hypothetical protein KJ554_02525, partial [bacterium]|nr:hypothetical protein [bacterium]